MAKPPKPNSPTGPGTGGGRPGSNSGSGNGAGRLGSNSGSGNGAGRSGSNSGSGNGVGRPSSKSGLGNGAGRPGSKSGLGNGVGSPGSSRSSQQLQKAYLYSQIDPVNPIEFMFNPTDLQFSRTVDIQTQCGAVTSKGLPKVVFGHVAPYELSLSGIVFDTLEKGTSVINEIQPLLDAVDFTKFNGAAGGASNPKAGGASTPRAGRRSNPKAGGKSNSQADSQKRQRPPVYYFMWGQQNYVQCMVKSLTCKLTMFLSDGTPVRAIVDISLQQVDLGTISTILS